MKIISQTMVVLYDDPSGFGMHYTKLYGVGWRLAGVQMKKDGTFNVTYKLEVTNE